jgi:hypothetical protein
MPASGEANMQKGECFASSVRKVSRRLASVMTTRSHPVACIRRNSPFWRVFSEVMATCRLPWWPRARCRAGPVMQPATRSHRGLGGREGGGKGMNLAMCSGLPRRAVVAGQGNVTEGGPCHEFSTCALYFPKIPERTMNIVAYELVGQRSIGDGPFPHVGFILRG